MVYFYENKMYTESELKRMVDDIQHDNPKNNFLRNWFRSSVDPYDIWTKWKENTEDPASYLTSYYNDMIDRIKTAPKFRIKYGITRNEDIG